MTREERAEALDVLTDMANALHLIPTTRQGKVFKMVLQELQKPEQEPCTDAISRQAVLDLAKFDGRENLGSIIHAFDVEQLPPVTPAEKQAPCADAISRAEALKHSFPIFDDDGVGYMVVRADKIEQLPSVNPTEKVGHWISNAEDDLKISEYTCSNCKGLSDEDLDFCPKCGSRMI